MKKVILWTVAVLLIMTSIAVAGYPFVSDYINNLNALDEVVKYSGIASEYTGSKALIEAARNYNANLISTTVIEDPFGEVYSYPDDYLKMLRVDGTDVMATIAIPKINVNLPIYHGTSADILKKGAGHLSTSSLPVGGKGTHCILSGHTGYSSLRLFSDIDRLEIGDLFYINCLNETYAYRVDQIKVVLPEETDDLQIDPEQDYVTLVTCTPFGVNTHRLLVRGTRTELDAEAPDTAEEAKSTWNEEYKKAIIAGVMLLAAILFVFFTLRFIVRRISRARRAKKGGADKS